mmetsp:Transcript_2450/g.5757  ORF Transcript_2450/g.5757 Transcript_2450/m.5757 type:complete len:173 (+) Transcript_2450:279-797(+)
MVHASSCVKAMAERHAVATQRVGAFTYGAATLRRPDATVLTGCEKDTRRGLKTLRQPRAMGLREMESASTTLSHPPVGGEILLLGVDSDGGAMKTAMTALSSIVFLLLIAVTLGVAYLSYVQWQDDRASKAEGTAFKAEEEEMNKSESDAEGPRRQQSLSKTGKGFGKKTPS